MFNFWPFNIFEKERLQIEEDTKNDLSMHNSIKEKLLKQFPIGALFDYLGVTLIITRVFDQGRYPITGIWYEYRIYADYIDKQGLICQASFFVEEAKISLTRIIK